MQTKYKMIDLMELIGGGTPKTNNPPYWNGDIPWISVKDFNGDRRYVCKTEKHVTQKGLENSSTKMLQTGDIIISARGTVGELAIISLPMAFNQSCYGIRAKQQYVDSMYLYYLMKYNIKILQRNTHGSVFDTITRDTFANIDVLIPSKTNQLKIASVLSSLDDKIELNNKINENLEQQADALYQAYFSPKTATQGQLVTLDEYCSIFTGKKNANASIAGGKFDLYQRTYACTLLDTVNVDYIFPLYWFVKLELSKKIMGGTRGSAIPYIVMNDLAKFEFIYNKENFESYMPLFKSLTETIQANEVENESLSQLRDTLLPKLMSGEIDVSNVTI